MRSAAGALSCSNVVARRRWETGRQRNPRGDSSNRLEKKSTIFSGKIFEGWLHFHMFPWMPASSIWEKRWFATCFILSKFLDSSCQRPPTTTTSVSKLPPTGLCLGVASMLIEMCQSFTCGATATQATFKGSHWSWKTIGSHGQCHRFGGWMRNKDPKTNSPFQIVKNLEDPFHLRCSKQSESWFLKFQLVEDRFTNIHM